MPTATASLQEPPRQSRQTIARARREDRGLRSAGARALRRRLRYRAWSWCLRAPDVLREQIHRFELTWTGGLINDDLKPIDFGEQEVARQHVDAGGVNRRFEHGMTSTVETDEFTADALMNRACLDSRSRRRAVDRCDLQLSPRARASEHHAAYGLRWHSLIRRVADRGLRKHAHIIDEIHHRSPRAEHVSIGGCLEERLQHDGVWLEIRIPLHSHGCAIHRALGVHRGHDGLDDHAPHSRVTSSPYAAIT